jgi:hypothetical protein
MEYKDIDPQLMALRDRLWCDTIGAQGALIIAVTETLLRLFAPGDTRPEGEQLRLDMVKLWLAEVERVDKEARQMFVGEKTTGGGCY